MVKNLPASAGDVREMGSIPGLERFPWRTPWQPTPVLLPGEIPGTEEPGRLLSVGLQRIVLDSSNLAHTFRVLGGSIHSITNRMLRTLGAWDQITGGLGWDGRGNETDKGWCGQGRRQVWPLSLSPTACQLHRERIVNSRVYLGKVPGCRKGQRIKHKIWNSQGTWSYSFLCWDK